MLVPRCPLHRGVCTQVPCVCTQVPCSIKKLTELGLYVHDVEVLAALRWLAMRSIDAPKITIQSLFGKKKLGNEIAWHGTLLTIFQASRCSVRTLIPLECVFLQHAFCTQCAWGSKHSCCQQTDCHSAAAVHQCVPCFFKLTCARCLLIEKLCPLLLTGRSSGAPQCAVLWGAFCAW